MSAVMDVMDGCDGCDGWRKLPSSGFDDSDGMFQITRRGIKGQSVGERPILSPTHPCHGSCHHLRGIAGGRGHVGRRKRGKPPQVRSGDSGKSTILLDEPLLVLHSHAVDLLHRYHIQYHGCECSRVGRND